VGTDSTTTHPAAAAAPLRTFFVLIEFIITPFQPQRHSPLCTTF
jgi:hypothetical protein